MAVWRPLCRAALCGKRGRSQKRVRPLFSGTERMGAAMRSSASLACALAVMAIESSPVRAHDIYSHLLDRNGKPCCNHTDCQPAPFKSTARGVEMFVNGRWIGIPTDKLQYRVLSGDSGATGGGHWCGSTDWNVEGFSNLDLYEVTLCAILPPNFALSLIKPSPPPN